MDGAPTTGEPQQTRGDAVETSRVVGCAYGRLPRRRDTCGRHGRRGPGRLAGSPERPEEPRPGRERLAGVRAGGLLGEGSSVYFVTGVHWLRATDGRRSDVGWRSRRVAADHTLRPWIAGAGVEWGTPDRAGAGRGSLRRLGGVTPAVLVVVLCGRFTVDGTYLGKLNS